MVQYGLILPTNSLHILAEMLPPLNVLKIIGGSNKTTSLGSGVIDSKLGFIIARRHDERLFIKYTNHGERMTLKNIMDAVKLAEFPDAKFTQVDFSVNDEEGTSHLISFKRDTIHVKYFDTMIKRKDQPPPFKKLIERLERFKDEAAERLNLSARQMQKLKPSPMFTFKLNPLLGEHAERLAYVNNNYLPCAILIKQSTGQFGLIYYEPKEVK